MDPIRTSIRKGQKVKLIVMTVLCVGAAIYGGWQVWFRIPERFAEYQENKLASEQFNALSQKSAEGETLTDAEVEQFYAAEKITNKYKDDPPQQPSKYDALINLWVWFIGGLIGVPFLLWPFWKYRDGGWKLLEDGSLITARGESIPSEQIQDIDMTTWRGLINPQASNKATWRAKLTLQDGRVILLDDYPWDGMASIITHFGHKFHPDTWDADGEPIQDGIERAAAELDQNEGAAEEATPAEETDDAEKPQSD